MLSKPDLSEIEEIAPQEITVNAARAEGNFQFEGSEPFVGEADEVQSRWNQASGHRSELKLLPLEHVEPQSKPDHPIEKRPFGTAIEDSLDFQKPQRLGRMRCNET